MLTEAVKAILWACEFDGIPIRPEEAVRAAGGLMEWEPKPLEIEGGPVGAEEPTEAETDAARRNWERMSPETRAPRSTRSTGGFASISWP